MATSGEKDRQEAEAKVKREAEEAGTLIGGGEPGPSGYVEPRPEQKSGEGQDVGQKQTETLNEADWNQREGSEAESK